MKDHGLKEIKTGEKNMGSNYCYDEQLDFILDKLNKLSDQLCEIIYLLKGFHGNVNNPPDFSLMRDDDYVMYRGVKVDKMGLKNDKEFVDWYIDSLGDNDEKTNEEKSE